ncbi:MAG: hypothetical protein QOJ52_2372, partial [Acidimicrobiaceae bacterium]|nr:hypothetical protein [Acidimicrobiaceae bacterium]
MAQVGPLPETRFDNLDMGTSIEESQRRGWIDHAYRGLFPDLADEDPRAELEAAHRVLQPGGHLLIEVP